jgi:hypothetical protein
MPKQIDIKNDGTPILSSFVDSFHSLASSSDPGKVSIDPSTGIMSVNGFFDGGNSEIPITLDMFTPRVPLHRYGDDGKTYFYFADSTSRDWIDVDNYYIPPELSGFSWNRAIAQYCMNDGAGYIDAPFMVSDSCYLFVPGGGDWYDAYGGNEGTPPIKQSDTPFRIPDFSFIFESYSGSGGWLKLGGKFSGLIPLSLLP